MTLAHRPGPPDRAERILAAAWHTWLQDRADAGELSSATVNTYRRGLDTYIKWHARNQPGQPVTARTLRRWFPRVVLPVGFELPDGRVLVKGTIGPIHDAYKLSAYYKRAPWWRRLLRRLIP